MYLVPRGVYLVWGWGVTGPRGCTWSWGVYLVLGWCTWSQWGVPGPGDVPGPWGCTWSRGCTWYWGVYLVPGGCTWSGGCTWGVLLTLLGLTPNSFLKIFWQNKLNFIHYLQYNLSCTILFCSLASNLTAQWGIFFVCVLAPHRLQCHSKLYTKVCIGAL